MSGKKNGTTCQTCWLEEASTDQLRLMAIFMWSVAMMGRLHSIPWNLMASRLEGEKIWLLCRAIFSIWVAQSGFASLRPAISFKISHHNFSLLGKRKNGCYALAPARLPVFNANRMCFTLHWRLLIWLRVCWDWLNYKNKFRFDAT